MPLGKKLIKGSAIAAFAAAAGLSPFIALEYTGYSYFDEPDGRNIICTIDPTCRRLTFGEVALAREVFGDRINYARVKVFDRHYGALEEIVDRNMAPNGNIYMPRYKRANKVRDFSENGPHQAIFIHEMAHVWQHQSGDSIYGRAIEAWVQNGFNYDVVYRYDVNGNRNFHALNLEQQADMVEDYFRARLKVKELARNGGSKAGIAEACRLLAPFEKRLFITLPIRPEPACAVIKALKASLADPGTGPAIG